MPLFAIPSQPAIASVDPVAPLPLKCKKPSPSVVTIRPVNVTSKFVKLPDRFVKRPSPGAIEAPENDTPKTLSKRILTQEHKLYPKAILKIFSL